jgi:hypothetical protein
MSERDWLEEIIGAPLTSISYESHPADEVLRAYIQGRLDRSGPLDTAGLRAGNLTIWHRAEVTAHLLTCRRCIHLVAELRAAPSVTPAPNRLKAFFERLFPTRQPMPAFARSIVIAQFAIILGLVGVIYFKPVPFFPSLNPMASVIPSSEITKPQEPAPQTPQPQALEQPLDPIPQLVQSYPQTIQVVFREDTPMRELTSLMHSVNGILILVHQRGFVVRLPSGDQVDSVMERLMHSPYILEARKD